MTACYRVLPAADRDLDIQADYLAREASIELALRFYDAARTSFERLAQMPGIGERRPTSNPQLDDLQVSRITGFEKHLAFYRQAKDGIEIIRILHGARDIDRVFDEEDLS